MIRKPNEGKKTENNQPNHIWRRFSNEFRVLLDTTYYQGSKFGQFFNAINIDGTSNIYVPDPYEGRIAEFDQSKFNEMKFMVGLTGMGKTTLIKNYYRITDKDFRFDDDHYVIYISFYRANLSLDKPYESVNNEVVEYLKRFIESLLQEYPGISICNCFWEGLYQFIIQNKPVLLATRSFTPGNVDFEAISKASKTQEEIYSILESLANNSPLEYYSSVIKYIMLLINKPYKISFIFDDIEAKDFAFHIHIIETARHMFSCFNATTDGNCTVKVLVSLRAYTFRSNVDRIAEARREALHRDVILKREAVAMHDIFDLRFTAIKNKRIQDKKIGNIESYNEAKSVLDYVEAKVNQIGSDLIFNLQNYNLCDSMVLYCEVLTNLVWITVGEYEKQGSFKLDGENYKITKFNLIRSIGMGNCKYYNGMSACVPNIIQYNGIGSELICIYIIRCLKNMKYEGVYGEQYIVGKELFQELVNLFCNSNTPDPIKRRWKQQIGDAISFLYNKGVLFRSLYDIEDESRNQIRREYYDSYKLYLSPRGAVLFDLLAGNSVLMELYRDDIAIDLPNNDMVTSDLNAFEKFEYIINLAKTLFQIEKENIAQALWNIVKYTELIGDTFICEHILKGVVNNINAYYGEHDEKHQEIVNLVVEFIKDMKEYAFEINKRYGEFFSVGGLNNLEANLH